MNPQALRSLSYGLYVLSTTESDTPFGCIINTAFQITAQPPRIAVSCNRDNFTNGKIKSSGLFGISVLPESTDSSLIGTFGFKSGRDIDKFETTPFEKGKETGVPLLTELTMAVFECRVVETLEVGTHTIFVGEVLDGEVTLPSEREMTYRYYHEKLRGTAPKNAPTYLKEEAAPEKKGELWKCSVCGYVYDSEEGAGDIPAGTAFENLPEGWICPVCGVGKEMFNPL